VVLGRINAVNPDGVDSELPKVRYVALTGGSVLQRINETGWLPKCVGAAGDNGTLRLICNTLDIKPGAVCTVKVSSSSCDPRDGVDTRKKTGGYGERCRDSTCYTHDF
jgi:hypothetical protein